MFIIEKGQKGRRKLRGKKFFRFTRSEQEEQSFLGHTRRTLIPKGIIYISFTIHLQYMETLPGMFVYKF
jgi:hypothetical protein